MIYNSKKGSLGDRWTMRNQREGSSDWTYLVISEGTGNEKKNQIGYPTGLSSTLPPDSHSDP